MHAQIKWLSIWHYVWFVIKFVCLKLGILEAINLMPCGVQCNLWSTNYWCYILLKKKIHSMSMNVFILNEKQIITKNWNVATKVCIDNMSMHMNLTSNF